MALPFSIDLSGPASMIAVLTVAGAYVLGVGLRCMALRELPLRHRRTIGRYMLVGVAMLFVVGAVTAIGSLRGEMRASCEASMETGRANSLTVLFKAADSSGPKGMARPRRAMIET